MSDYYRDELRRIREEAMREPIDHALLEKFGWPMIMGAGFALYAAHRKLVDAIKGIDHGAPDAPNVFKKLCEVELRLRRALRAVDSANSDLFRILDEPRETPPMDASFGE